MKFSFGITLILIGLCILDCEAKPTEVTKDNDKTSIEEDDSDMMMEPNEFSHVSVIKSEGRQIFPSTTEYDTGSSLDDDDESNGPDPDSHSQAAQNFYPQYFRNSPSPPPLGHSRPYFPAGSDGPSKFIAARSFDQSILGSGDFGVMRGGTFYPEDEAPYHQEENSDYNPFFNNGDNSNGERARSQLSDSYVQKFTYPEEQFANFRDFADINTPSDSAYSQFVVVYANKNSTSYHPNPKNIFEQLELLDKEKELEQKKNRISKSKSKLANTKLEKKYKKKNGPKDLDYEPLLALS